MPGFGGARSTNVFVGACLGTGAASQGVRACATGRVVPLMGSALLAEYEDVLSHAALSEGCRLTQAEREDLLDIFIARCPPLNASSA